ncbi:hypothetical protein B0J12DRAFT_768400 [Macrophomina phaseolina]|uniref:C2H2-type domain-containing protein n=1 Tax=Macrophomina phaseolina TaxID=35725 RepID=A0ABQ8FWC3_9PEZI|nr:hypothetical protein B0J12DRAFT_768400 [Macrophomina phaseolina]
MLACYPRRQHADTSSLPSPTPSHLNFYTNLSQPSPTELQNDRLLRNYFQQQSSTPLPTTSRPDANQYADQYMTSSFNFSNPSIRIQQSTPAPQLPSTYSTTNLMMDNGANTLSWDTFGNNSQLTAGPSSLHSSAINNSRRSHQRSPSSSTNGSNVESSYTADDISGTFSNHLPTPSHTPTQDSFASSSYSNFNMNNNQTTDGGMAAHMAMKQALMDQHHQTGNDGSCPDFGHSSRQSVSSYGADSPATPHNGQEDVFNDDRFKVPSNGEKSFPRVENWIDEYLQFPDESDMRPVPKLDRTMTDIYADELFNPNAMAPAPAKQSSQASNNTLLSPFRNVITDRLQAAHQARSQSPASSMSRGVSPFRQGSPLAPQSNSFASPQVRLGTAQHLREQQKAEADAYALQHSQRQPDMSEPKTISPKDALLDYHESEEDSKMPLFPDASANDYDQSYTSGDQGQYDGSSEVSYGSTATSQGGNWSSQAGTSFPSVSGPSPPQSNFNFQPPTVPNVMQGLPFNNANAQYRSVTSMPVAGQEENPQFHPQLTSMDSSASEMPESSQNSNEDSSTPTQRPSHANADTGTYTCTYHGCTLRFETPQKLQKHKRDGHRPHAATPGVGSGMTSAQLLARNSQAGPHKCERINPTTGKPCNTIFSRPYDLTRHEDTIHNARKQKVRCALCVEEKTFSRNDALTRHMRVVHPEVDFPGKHRRRGGSSSYE